MQLFGCINIYLIANPKKVSMMCHRIGSIHKQQTGNKDVLSVPVKAKEEYVSGLIRSPLLSSPLPEPRVQASLGYRWNTKNI